MTDAANDPDPSRFDAIGVHARVRVFIGERIAGHLRDAGYRYDLVDAVLAAGVNAAAGASSGAVDFADLRRRLDALTALTTSDGFADLVEVVDRCWRIIRGGELSDDAAVDPERFEQSEEHALFEALAGVRDDFAARCAAGDLEEAARVYREALAAPVHAFFDKVFVNAEDPAVRTNRLALLRDTNRLFVDRFADLSKVVEGKK